MRSSSGASLVLCISLLAACYAAEPDSDADKNTNWLQCEKTSECEVGECVAGWCTPPGPPPEGSRELGGAAGDAIADAATTDQPGRTQDPLGPEDAGGTGAMTSALVAPALFELEDIRLKAGSEPVMGWEDDHALVAWVETASTTSSELVLVHVTRDGAVDRYDAAYSSSDREGTQMVLGDSGRIAVASVTTGCGIDIYTAQLQPTGSAVHVPCWGDTRRVAAVPIPGSEDWILAFTTTFAEIEPPVVSVGRFQVAGGWSLIKTLAPFTADDHLSVFAAGSDMNVVWGGPAGTLLSSGNDLARADFTGLDTEWSEPIAIGEDTGDGAPVVGLDGYRFADLGEHRLLFGRADDTLWMYSLAADGSTHSTLSSAINGTTGVAAAKQLGVAGVCFAIELQATGERSSAVWFVTVDGDGRLSEPVTVAADLPSGAGCSVAWSGTHFVAVAWGIPSGVGDQTTRMRGTLIDPSELR